MGSIHDDSSRLPARVHSAATTPASDPSQLVREKLDQSINKARQFLLAQQHDHGYWCGELQGDTILESEYILLLAWLGELDRPAAAKAARYILQQQLPQGGWALYPGGDVEISGSVKAYFALKLTGHDPRGEPMRLAREAIIAHGGADAVNSFTRFYLALLGQISYDHCPAVAPEAVLLPRWFPINIYRISSWSRAILVPLSIMWAHRPTSELPRELGIDELFVRPPDHWPELRCPGTLPSKALFSWDRFFRLLDRGTKQLERFHIRPLRSRALRTAERWMTDRFVDSDGLGAIFPPIVWSLIALKCLGYSDHSAQVRYCHEQLDALMIEENDTVRLQPCQSPIWDTALTLRALAATGKAGDEAAVVGATEWLLEKEVVRPGDWSMTVASPPGGWFFEHHNAFYPDLDDTAVVLAALREHFVPQGGGGQQWEHSVLAGTTASNVDEARGRAILLDRVVRACQRARHWTLAMQNRDGGWGAFDKENNRAFLCHVPFADHNAMIDPSSPDITGRVLEALAGWGATLDDPAMARAVTYLRRTQEPDGCWPGRWGVNYVYGTWQALVGLALAGIRPTDECMQSGANWLLRHQQHDGGWGESADSYVNPALRGQGRATPSQTAWALMGLMACGMHADAPVRRGIEFLIGRQQPDGSWHEPEFTGTGFPRVFYLRYHMYPLYFPLLALGRYQAAVRQPWK